MSSCRYWPILRATQYRAALDHYYSPRCCRRSLASPERPSLSLSQVLKIHLRGLWWKMWGFVQASFSFGLHSFIVFGAAMLSSMYSHCRCAGVSCCGPSHRRPRLSSLMTRALCCPRPSIFQCCIRGTGPHRRNPAWNLCFELPQKLHWWGPSLQLRHELNMLCLVHMLFLELSL